MPQSELSPKSTIEAQLVSWLESNSRGNHKVSLDENYVESGVIDSFDLIVFIESIEDNYHIKFNNREFQDRRFVIVSGLAEIIDEKVRLQLERD